MNAADRLDEIQRRSDDATEGPWWGSMISGHCEVFAGTGSGSDPMIATELLPGDAEFVINARTDVPALVLALRSVLNVHEPVDALHTPTGQKVQVCSECERDGDWRVWPCLTVRAVTNAFKEAER